MGKTRSGRKYGEIPVVPLPRSLKNYGKPRKNYKKTRNNYRKKKFVPLMQLHDLVPKIIGKMANLELVRMRQTCSALNSLVEKRAEILSKRIMKADSKKKSKQSLINLTIDVRKEKENDIYLNVNKRRMRFEGDLKERLGPFTINSITVAEYDNCSPAKYAESVQWIRQMNLRCAELILRLPVQFTYDVLEAVEHVSHAKLKFRKRLTANDFHLLSSSRHVGVIELDLEKASLHAVPVEIVKKFRKISICCYKAQAWRNMIEDLETTNDNGNLEWIQYSSVYPYHIGEFKIPFPRLYKGDKPHAIYCKELQKKQLVIVHSTSNWTSRKFEFFFIEKESAALTDFLIEHMEFKDDVREDFPELFTRASFAKKCELLKEAMYEDERKSIPIMYAGRRGIPSYMIPPYSSDSDDAQGASSESESESGSTKSSSDSD